MRRGRTTRAGPPVAIVALGVCAIACVSHGPAAAVADRINKASLPYVEYVEYAPANAYGDHPRDTLWVYLTDEATDPDVIDLYCRIITPDDATAIGSSNIGMEKGVTWWPPGATPPTGYSGGERVNPPACSKRT